LERGCVQNTSRGTLKSFALSGVFQQAGFVKSRILEAVSRRTHFAPETTPALNHRIGNRL